MPFTSQQYYSYMGFTKVGEPLADFLPTGYGFFPEWHSK